jgi:hypothetical protein
LICYFSHLSFSVFDLVFYFSDCQIGRALAIRLNGEPSPFSFCIFQKSQLNQTHPKSR